MKFIVEFQLSKIWFWFLWYCGVEEVETIVLIDSNVCFDINYDIIVFQKRES